MLDKIKQRGKDVLLDKVFDMLENIDLFDQLADMLKTVVPLKADITVKGKKALEITFHGIKDGQLWISVKRIRKSEQTGTGSQAMPCTETTDSVEKEDRA